MALTESRGGNKSFSLQLPETGSLTHSIDRSTVILFSLLDTEKKGVREKFPCCQHTSPGKRVDKPTKGK